MKFRRSAAWLALCWILPSGSALAQELTTIPVFTGQPFRAERSPDSAGARDIDLVDLGLGGRLKGSVDLLGTYTSNFFYANSSEHKQSVLGAALLPNLVYENTLPRLVFRGGLGSTLAFLDTPQHHDNYADVNAYGSVDWSPLRLNTFGASIFAQNGHDPFGTNRTETASAQSLEQASGIDTWISQTYTARYGYGGSGSRIAVESKLSYTDKQYTSNRSATRFQDFHNVQGEATAFYLIGAKTSVLLNFIGAGITTPNVAPGFFDRGGVLLRLRTGARWQATAKTNADVRVGVVRRDFNESSLPTFNQVDWDVNLNYAQSSFNRYRFNTGRRIDESYIGNVGFIDNRFVEAHWTRDWSPLFSTDLVGNYVRSRFVGTSRNDNNYFASLFANYAVTRYVSVVGIAAFGRRLTNPSVLDYSRADVYLGLKYTPLLN